MVRFFSYLKLKLRWLSPNHNAVTNTSATATAGRVYLSLLEVPVAVTVNQIVWNNGATVSGNVRAGIYGLVVTEDTCEASPIAIASAEVAQAGVSVPQAVSLTPTVLQPGRYYVALEFSSATATFIRQSTQVQVDGWMQQYDRSGGYGALTTPCPAIAAATIAPIVRVRCA